MIGTSIGAVLDGIHATVVFVEADVSTGLPNFSIVGLPDSAVSESKLRIRSAIRNAGFEFPAKRITVNLSPASMKKRGAGLDLAIAIAILRASKQLPQTDGPQYAFCAELGLSGTLVATRGIAHMAFALQSASIVGIVVSATESAGTVPIPGMEWYGFNNLQELAFTLQTSQPLPPMDVSRKEALDRLPNESDMSEVSGMVDVKRSLCIAAIGSHHILLVGPPGCGKTMLAERLPSILPSLTPTQSFEVYAHYQAAGLDAHLTLTPPLRSPHHSLTMAGLIGGGIPPSPGEITLSHHGVLLLDEFLEFSRQTLEALREPLMTGRVRMSRAGRSYDLPAEFQLIATLNPCPCGQRGFGDCRCTDAAVKKYWTKLSGPLLDRIDIMLYISPTHRTSQPIRTDNTNSATLRKQVKDGRERLALLKRRCQSGEDMDANTVLEVTDTARRLLYRAAESLGLSQRKIRSTLDVAQSICCLEGEEQILREHVEEAIAIRSQVSLGQG